MVAGHCAFSPPPPASPPPEGNTAMVPRFLVLVIILNAVPTVSYVGRKKDREKRDSWISLSSRTLR